METKVKSVTRSVAKRERLIKKLEKVKKENGISFNSHIYQKLLCVFKDTDGKGYKIRPVVEYGYGRWITYSDHTSRFEWILNLLKVKYRKGNDAPRGGRLGDFIEILTKIYD